MRFVRIACTTHTMRSTTSISPIEPKPNIRRISRKRRVHSASWMETSTQGLGLLLEFAARALLPIRRLASGFPGCLPRLARIRKGVRIAPVKEKDDARQSTNIPALPRRWRSTADEKQHLCAVRNLILDRDQH